MSAELAILDGVTSFNRFLGDLGNVAGPGSSADAIVRGEIGSLLKVCIEYTPQATDKNIRRRAEYRFNEKYAVRGAGDLKLTYNTGVRGGNPDNVWLRSGGKFHIMAGPGRWSPQPDKSGKFSAGAHSRVAPGGAHWPDWLWAQYKMLEEDDPQRRAELKKEWTAKALASRGLARLSWFQVAESLSIEVPGVTMSFRDAKGSDGKTYLNGAGHKLAGVDVQIYELINQMPALVSGGLDGRGILSRAMATREKAFEVALEKGLFQDLEFVSKRYPGMLA